MGSERSSASDYFPMTDYSESALFALPAVASKTDTPENIQPSGVALTRNDLTLTSVDDVFNSPRIPRKLRLETKDPAANSEEDGYFTDEEQSDDRDLENDRERDNDGDLDDGEIAEDGELIDAEEIRDDEKTGGGEKQGDDGDVVDDGEIVEDGEVVDDRELVDSEEVVGNGKQGGDGTQRNGAESPSSPSENLLLDHAKPRPSTAERNQGTEQSSRAVLYHSHSQPNLRQPSQTPHPQTNSAPAKRPKEKQERDTGREAKRVLLNPTEGNGTDKKSSETVSRALQRALAYLMARSSGACATTDADVRAVSRAIGDFATRNGPRRRGNNGRPPRRARGNADLYGRWSSGAPAGPAAGPFPASVEGNGNSFADAAAGNAALVDLPTSKSSRHSSRVSSRVSEDKPCTFANDGAQGPLNGAHSRARQPSSGNGYSGEKVYVPQDEATAHAAPQETRPKPSPTPRRFVGLYVTGSDAEDDRCEKLRDIMLQESRLAVHVMRYRPDDYGAWRFQLSRQSVVLIVNASDLLNAARSGALSLSKVDLLVYEKAERIHDAADPVRVVIREMCQMLPVVWRPRILALCSVPSPSAPVIAALEYYAHVEFYDDPCLAHVRCRERIIPQNPVTKAPLAEYDVLYYALDDVAQISTLQNDEPSVGQGGPELRAPESISGARSNIDHVVHEIGSLGVALYQHRVHSRKLRRRWRRIAHANETASAASASPPRIETAENGMELCFDRDLLIGLSSKTMSLLNVLQTWKSARNTCSGCVIYASRATVAVALVEVISALPGLSDLSCRAVLGDGLAARSFETEANRYDDENDDEASGWQGHETDDEAVGSFVAQGTDVLVVASENLAEIRRTRRPIPPCNLVLRFDGSPLDPDADGGGGRCRVVRFLPDYKTLNTNDSRGKGTHAAGSGRLSRRRPNQENRSRRTSHLNHAAAARTPMNGLSSSISALPQEENKDRMHILQLNTDDNLRGPSGTAGTNEDQRTSISPSTPGAKVLRRSTLQPSVRRSGFSVPRSLPSHRRGYFAKHDANSSERASVMFQVEPAPALRGPSTEIDSECFLYSIRPKPEQFPRGRQRDVLGLGNFVLVLTAKLGDRDLLVAGAHIANDLSTDTNLKIELALEPVGKCTLTTHEVQLGRKYTSAMFGIVMRSLDHRLFQWGARASAKGEMTRRYLVLPAKHDVQIPQYDHWKGVVLRTREEALHFYFGQDYLGYGHCIGMGNTPRRLERDFLQDFGPETRNVVGIDWDAAERLCEFQKAAEAGDQAILEPTKGPFDLTRVEELDALQGSIVYAGYCGKIKPYMVGFLDHSLSPLTKFLRQKRFPLDSSGNLEQPESVAKELVLDLVDFEELPPDLQAVFRRHPAVEVHDQDNGKKPGESEEDFLSRQAREHAGDLFADPLPIPCSAARSPERKRIRSADGAVVIRSHVPEDERHGREAVSNGHRALQTPSTGVTSEPRRDACDQEQAEGTEMEGHQDRGMQARDGVVGRKRKAQVFDAAKNKRKRRQSWFGPVIETYEAYFRSTRNVNTERLDQPLLPVSAPEPLPMSRIAALLKGGTMSGAISERYDEYVRANPDCKLYMIPETMHLHPLPVGALSIPPCLRMLERHVSMCALRDIFEKQVGTEIEIEALAQATTSASVNPHSNYERLELLGDAILKLSSTIRLFVKYPHMTEGELHPERCAIVSNHVLYARAKEVGIHHYLNVNKDALVDWSPPGWDRDATPRLLQEKTLADVVEAIAGAFYLRGVAEYAQNTDDVLTVNAPCAGEEEAPVTTPEKISHESLLSSTKAILHGYGVGARFLEVIGVLVGEEPDQEEMLRSAVHSMHPKGSPPPTYPCIFSFPADPRISNPSTPWEDHLGGLERRLGYTFKHRHLLMSAVTHGSYTEACPETEDAVPLGMSESFQRLEFLGDAAIDFCVTRYLFDRYPEQGPGELTELKSAVVSNEAFARVCVKRGFHKYLYTRAASLRKDIRLYVGSMKEETDGKGLDGHLWLQEREAPKVLGDIFEAIAGAVLVDSGLEVVWNVYMNLLEDMLRERADPATFETHPVKVLQDHVTRVQKLSFVAPQYVIPEDFSADSLIRADVYVHKTKVGSGHGSTKKRAMCRAAIDGYRRLSATDPTPEDAELLHRLRIEGDKQRASREAMKPRTKTRA